MKIKDLGSSNNRMFENISKTTSMKGVFGNIPKIPKMISIQPMDSFHKSKSTDEALEEESDCRDERFKIDEHHCEICDSTLVGGAYILINMEKTLYFCSTNCINQFKKNGNNLNNFGLFEVSRCASFKCCLELGNLRRKCEKTKSLTNIDLLSSLSGINFCDPAVAGQIQASYAIYKHLQKVDEENEKLSLENIKLNKRTQFLTIISTIMAFITIVLSGISVINSLKDKSVEYNDELNNIHETLQSEMEDIEAIRMNNEKIVTSIESIIIHTTDAEKE